MDIKVGQKFLPNETIASQDIINNYSGIVDFDNFSKNREINVINSLMILENGLLTKISDNFDDFEVTSQNTKKILVIVMECF